MASQLELRASDDDRKRSADVLGEHLVAGRLTLTEFEVRVATAYAATTLGTLHQLTHDLPRSPASSMATGADVPIVDRGGPWGSWAFSNAICLLIWGGTSLVEGQALAFWPAWVLLPWAAVLLISGVLSRQTGGRRALP